MQKELDETLNNENGEKLLEYLDYISKNRNDEQNFIDKIHNLKNIGVKNILFIIKILNTSIDFDFQKKKNYFSKLLEKILIILIKNKDNEFFFQTIPSLSLLILSTYLKYLENDNNKEKENILINFIEKNLLKIIPLHEIGKIFIFYEDDDKFKNIFEKIKNIYSKTEKISYNSFYEKFYRYIKQKNYKKKNFSFQKINKKTFSINKNEIILSAKPIPKEYLIFYFECHLISYFETDYFSFGLSKTNDKNKTLFICYNNSGKINTGELNYKYSQSYNRNDIVGCLINKIEKSIYFIKNGEQKIKINYVFQKEEELYPGISISKYGLFNMQLYINNNYQSFPFCFNFQKYLDDFLNKYYDSIIQIDIYNTKNDNELSIENNSKLDLLICDYMLYNAYLDSYNEMKTITYGKKGKHMNNLKIGIRKKIRELLEKKNFDEIDDLIQNNFINYESSIKILNFYKVYYDIYNNFMEDYKNNSPEIISNLILNLRQKIIFNENYLDIYKKLYKSSTEKLLHNVFNPKFENQVNIDAFNNFINETLSSDEMFSNINSEILKSNYSIYLNEIESILKNLILVLCKNLDLNLISGINFILTYPNFLNVLNEKLIKLELSCEEIQMEKFFIEYFKNLTIYDK